MGIVLHVSSYKTNQRVTFRTIFTKHGKTSIDEILVFLDPKLDWECPKHFTMNYE